MLTFSQSSALADPLVLALSAAVLSRPRQEMRVFTDDQVRLDRLLQNEEIKKMALHPRQIEGYNRVA